MIEPVAICAPAGRDEDVVLEILQGADIAARPTNAATLIAGIENSDYAAVLLTEEALGTIPPEAMQDALAVQPPWSDLPFVILRSKGLPGPKLAAALALLGNAVQVERPVSRTALIDIVRNVLRARHRQIEARTYLEEREVAERRLRDFADGLEQQVAARTRHLLATSRRLSFQIDERIAAQERLNQMQAELVHISRVSAMGTMASTLAHELNQPLTATLNYIRGSMRLLSTIPDLAEPTALGGLERAVESAHRAGEIVRRLREFVSRGTVERRAENLPKLIEESIAIGLVDAIAQGVTIELALDPRASSIFADRVQIQQVLINLLRNAVDAMVSAAQREVVIASRYLDRSNMVEVSVTDTGSGMTPDQIATLFSPFTSSKDNGMGVGLSICRTIVEANGGAIIGENKPAGGGAVFRFTAPAGLAPNYGISA